MVREQFSIAALALALGAPAVAAEVPFPGPDGWSKVAVPASTDTTREFEEWHIAGAISTVGRQPCFRPS